MWTGLVWFKLVAQKDNDFFKNKKETDWNGWRVVRSGFIPDTSGPSKETSAAG